MFYDDFVFEEEYEKLGITEEEAKAVRAEGRNAYLGMISSSENPHSNSSIEPDAESIKFQLWKAGWFDAAWDD